MASELLGLPLGCGVCAECPVVGVTPITALPSLGVGVTHTLGSAHKVSVLKTI